MTALQQQGAAAKAATYVLATAGTAKKNTADIADDTSIPRVAVIPMNTPSQMNAAIPHSGMSTAHGTYDADASMTLALSVSNMRNGLPPRA